MIQHKYPDGPSASHRPLRSIIIELCELDGRFHYALYWSTKRTFGCILGEKSRLSNLGLGDDAILPTFHYPAFIEENINDINLVTSLHHVFIVARGETRDFSVHLEYQNLDKKWFAVMMSFNTDEGFFASPDDRLIYPMAFLEKNMQPSLERAIHYAIMALRRQGVRCPIFDRLHS